MRRSFILRGGDGEGEMEAPVMESSRGYREGVEVRKLMGFRGIGTFVASLINLALLSTPCPKVLRVAACSTPLISHARCPVSGLLGHAPAGSILSSPTFPPSPPTATPADPPTSLPHA